MRARREKALLVVKGPRERIKVEKGERARRTRRSQES